VPVDEASRDGRRDMDGELSAFCFEEWPKLVAVLSLYCGDRDLAEDVAQEALLRVCVHWATVARADAPDRWLYRVAFNLAKSHWRRRKVARRIEARTRRSASSPVDDADAADAVAVRLAVSALPERQRQAVVLRYYVDLSVGEVAQFMGCPEGTVKTLTSRAIATLRLQGLVERPYPTRQVT
jgi:RNA polymerase sigma-70 factor (sigma-E family)